MGSKDSPAYSIRQRLYIKEFQVGIIGGDYPNIWSFPEERHQMFLETVSTYRRRRVQLEPSRSGKVQPISLPNYKLIRSSLSSSKTVSYYSPYAHHRKCLKKWLNPGEKLEIVRSFCLKEKQFPDGDRSRSCTQRMSARFRIKQQ